MNFKAKQQGFTLLELLVVITLLAVLSVGALVAYEGVGDKAQATAAANNISVADRAIRNYRAVTQNYPTQWDNLVTTTGAPLAFLAEDTTEFLAVLDTAAASAVMGTAFERLEGVGIDELQQRSNAALTADVSPQKQHNEASAPLDAADYDIDNAAFVVVLPGAREAVIGTPTACTYGTATANKLDGNAITVADARRFNSFNDALDLDECHLVVALGFGHDAASSTANSSVAVATAPTYSSAKINPSTTYARYIALFHLGSADADDVGASDLFAKPRLLAVVDPEGNNIDTKLVEAFQN